MKENGYMIRDRVKGTRDLLMVINMKDNILIINLTDKVMEYGKVYTGTHILVNGRMV
jgi:hypothetical protein